MVKMVGIPLEGHRGLISPMSFSHSFMFCFILFETGSYYVALTGLEGIFYVDQADLKLPEAPPLPPERWDERSEPPCCNKKKSALMQRHWFL